MSSHPTIYKIVLDKEIQKQKKRRVNTIIALAIVLLTIVYVFSL